MATDAARMTYELAEAERLRDVFIRDQQHVATLNAMVEAVDRGLHQVATSEALYKAMAYAEELRKQLQDVKLDLENSVTEQNQRIADLREGRR